MDDNRRKQNNQRMALCSAVSGGNKERNSVSSKDAHLGAKTDIKPVFKSYTKTRFILKPGSLN